MINHILTISFQFILPSIFLIRDLNYWSQVINNFTHITYQMKTRLQDFKDIMPCRVVVNNNSTKTSKSKISYSSDEALSQSTNDSPVDIYGPKLRRKRNRKSDSQVKILKEQFKINSF